MFLSNCQARGLLADHFTGDGQIDVFDIVSAESWSCVTINDPEDFADAHLLGPGGRQQGTSISAPEGVSSTSFFRSLVRPFDQHGESSVISIELTDQYALEPTDFVAQLGASLHKLGIPYLLERSFRVGRWVFWILLTAREPEHLIKEFTGNLYADLRFAKVLSSETCIIPAIEDTEFPHVPMHFFSGGYFGQLYNLEGRHLRPADLSETPHYDLATGGIQLVSYGHSRETEALSALLQVWWEGYGSKRLRARVILDLLHSASIVLPSLEAEPQGHQRAIALGRLLQSLGGKMIDGYQLHGRSSGNSTVYWLTPISLG